MSGKHANVKGAMLTFPALLARLPAEARAELAEQRPAGRHATRRTSRQPSAA
jgi:hypothetical protein